MMAEVEDPDGLGPRIYLQMDYDEGVRFAVMLQHITHTAPWDKPPYTEGVVVDVRDALAAAIEA